jgi:hypothetical protein
VPWLRPLEVVIQSKHDKNSPEGAAMRDVVELRVEAADGWLKPPYSLTLCVILKEGMLPSFSGEEPPCPPDLAGWLRTESGELRRTSGEIAARLDAERRVSPSSVSVYLLWQALAEAWATRCRPGDLRAFTSEEAAKIRIAVSVIEADVFTESGFDLYRYRRSEQLDLDHLSPPTPV